MSNNKHFADLLKVCSILPALAIMPAMAEDFTQNGASKKVENGEIFDLSQYDSVLFDGGAKIQNYGTVKLGGDVRFENATMHNYYSSTEEQSKIVYDGDGNITFFDSRISNPGIEYDKETPAIVGGLVDFKTTGDISFSGDMEPTGSSAYVNTTILSDMVLQANKISVSGAKSDGYGGAIFNAGDLKILGKENLFTDNHQTAVAAEGKYYKLGGGALYNRGAEGTAEMVVGLADGSSVNKFISNSALQNGGAIETRTDDPNSHSVLDVIGKTTFSENTAGVNGGAIMNWVDSSQENATSVINIIGEVNFDNNTAGENGGAIYNTGTVDLSKAVAEFDGNIASLEGGAIYNQGDMKIAKAEFENNKASVYGGAISNRATMTIQDAKFKENISYGNFGGALYNSKSGNIETLDADFSGNKIVNEGSAAGGAISNIGKIGELTGMFDKNVAQATGSSAKGGAIHAYAGSYVDSVVADFTANSAVSSENEAIGGAIVNDGNIGTLHQAGSGFVNNSVSAKTNGWAGALYNSETGVISELVANFTGNSVQGTDWALGGALVNKGTIESMSGVFANNSVVATSEEGYALGGAIYNGVDATINFDGDVLFSNNTALEGADIYNDGIVNIVSGTTTIDTAVAGEGTLNVASDAILNIGTATVQQTQINIDGIVKASVLSGRSHGRLIASAEDGLKIGDNAELHLSVGGVGEYDMFGGEDATFKKVTFGDSYLVEQLDNGVIKVTTKSVDDLAADTGLTTQAAGAIASLSNSHSDKIQQISLALQEVLNSGDVKAVESVAKKLNPENRPVAQSLASSVQNQVLSLVAGRMAGGAAMGRAGGDIPQENGFWMHGLFNKSKLAKQFHGYTRGVAFGFDTLIDGEYTLGSGLAINNSDVHSNGRGHTEIDSKTMFMYGQYKPSEWFVNAAVTYSMAEYTEQATVAGYVLTDEYDVDSYGAQVMAGYDFDTGITTEFGVRYLHIAQEDYTKESGATVSAVDTDVLTTVAGAKYAFAIENDWAIQLKPELRAALTYDWLNDSDAAIVDMPGVATYKVDGKNLNRLGAELGAGVTLDYKGLKVTLMYDLDLHKEYTSQTGMIKFRGRF